MKTNGGNLIFKDPSSITDPGTRSRPDSPDVTLNQDLIQVCRHPPQISQECAIGAYATPELNGIPYHCLLGIQQLIPGSFLSGDLKDPQGRRVAIAAMIANTARITTTSTRVIPL